MASNSTWTWEQHKKFQNALAIYGIDETPEVKSYYEKLMVEIKKIEAALIYLPRDEELAELEARNEEKDCNVAKATDKTEEEVKLHYQTLVEDVKNIAPDLVSLPNFFLSSTMALVTLHHLYDVFLSKM
ncbi:hypothetical protein H5410_063294, partial [Solanum commersonii]